jgi:ribosomal protein S6
VYEGTFIFSDRMTEDDLNAAIASAAEEITKLKGQIVKTEKLGRRQFARPMKKQTSGQYVRLRFDIAPGAITELHEHYKLNDHVFRVQIVRASEIVAPTEEEAAAEKAEA